MGVHGPLEGQSREGRKSAYGQMAGARDLTSTRLFIVYLRVRYKDGIRVVLVHSGRCKTFSRIHRERCILTLICTPLSFG